MTDANVNPVRARGSHAPGLAPQRCRVMDDASILRWPVTLQACIGFAALLAGCGGTDAAGLTGDRAGSTPAGGNPVDSSGGFAPGLGFTPGPSTGATSACAAIAQTAVNRRGPADIIFALDNSGSMDEEAIFVQQNMNAFSRQIVAAAVDARVVVISGYPGDGNGICIDAPLGSGGCPEKDNKLPSFLHVDEEVSSNDALELVIGTFPDYRSVLRPDAQKHVVVVTDDESDLSAEEARTEILALAPPLFDGFIFHGIFAFTEGEGDQCEDFAAAAGEQYKELVAETGGVSGDLCLQDFAPVFDRLAQAVVGNTKLACEWSIPPAPAGATFDPQSTNLRLSAAGLGDRSIGRVESASACSATADGWAWYYDDARSPTRLLICPEACATVQKYQDARVDIEFGCPTIDVPPVR